MNEKIMNMEEWDAFHNRLLALMATLLLQGQIETFNGIEIGGKRKLKIEVAVTWAEDILACVWQRDAQERVKEKAVDSADRGEPQGPDSPWRVEEPKRPISPQNS